MSFVLKIIAQDGGAVRYLTATEAGQACWFYLRISEQHYSEYQQKLKQKAMNIRDYGEIVESGWGEYPPEDVIDRMKKQFGVITPPRAN